MENGTGSPVTVRAKFKFEGANNDELSFNKNDLITITQQQEGGWWEGTINGMTGWFPCAYVTVVTEKDKLMRSKSVPNATANELVKSIDQSEFRKMVLNEYVPTERIYIENLEKTIETMLLPIGNSGLITLDDYNTLVGNFEDIFTIQKKLLTAVETERSVEPSKQRIGGVFLKSASELRDALCKYAENHPKAVEVIKEKQKDLEKIMNENSKDLKELVSGLSEPLRHVEKYYNMLQELERIVPESHSDRGDLQRSAFVFKETKDLSETMRKQKEHQLDFLYVSKIEEIVPFAERGTIKYVGIATVDFGDQCIFDRFVALFARYIMFFEVTTSMGYQIKEKYQVAGFTVKKQEPTDIVLEKPGMRQIVMSIVTSGGEQERWISAFSKADGVIIAAPAPALTRRPSKNNADIEHALFNKPPLSPSNPETVLRRKSSKNFDDSMNTSGMKFDHDLEMILPEGFSLPTSSRNSRSQPDHMDLSQLPSYFMSGNQAPRNDKGFRMRKDAARDEDAEFETLRVIEGYCAETPGQQDKSFSSNNNTPHLIVVEDEKIMVEEKVGDEVVFQEKSIVDAVYSIKDELSVLQNEFNKLSKILEAEQKARRRLEHSFGKQFGITSSEGSSTIPRNAVNSFDS